MRRFGDGNRVFSFACLGIAPQDLKYADEPTRLHDRRRQRHSANTSPSRAARRAEAARPRIGSDCLIMAYTHIGHDSSIGNGCILANSATLAGHVTVEDFATVGALCPVHQFCRIGRYAYVGGGTTITQDVLPYSLTSIARDNHAYGLNKVGLERRGFTAGQLKELRAAYRVLTGSKKNVSQALEELRADADAGEHVRYLVDFVAASERGVIR